jgi:2-dehydro-3-deoxyphosphogalactonate aldolase
VTPFKTRLQRAPLVAILRGVVSDEVEAIGAVLIESGFEIIEVPLNSPRPFASIEKLARTLGDAALIGAGTVLRPEQVDSVFDAGGRLIVMPHTDGTVIRRTKERGLTCIPGFATPTEAFEAIFADADALKLFPAEGTSPSVLKALRAVLPHDMPIIPVGGIDQTRLESWLQAGAAGFGIGSALYRPGIRPAELHDRASNLMIAMQALLPAVAADSARRP